MARRLPFLLSILAAALAITFPAFAQSPEKKKATPVMAPAPPPAMPQKVRVARGRKIDIPLRIYGRANETLRYLIKTPPAKGTLSEPRAVDRESASIAYQAAAEVGATSDRFTFSVQSSAGVSAPVEVSIEIYDEAPLLTMPGGIEFAAILAGASATQDFQLANRGGGMAVGEVKVRPPWRIEGRTDYELMPGDLRYFKITFAPSEAGEFRGEIQYSSDREHSTVLHGLAHAPVAAEPPAVTLRHEPGFALRTGVFEIVNRTGEARNFRINAGPRLRVEKEVSVPAEGRVAVGVSAAESDVKALDDAVRVEAEGFSLRVPVKAAAVGPILRFSPSRLNLGALLASRGGQMNLEVENTGGAAVEITGEIAAPFKVEPAAFKIGAGEKRQAIVAIEPGTARPYRGWLKLKGAPVMTELEVAADLVADAKRTGIIAGSSHPRPPRESRREPNPVELPEWMPDLNVAKAIRVRELTPATAQIEWPADLSSATNFRLERMIFMRDSGGEFRNVWLDLPKVKFRRDGTQWVTSIQGLAPQQPQTVRVVPISPGGAPGDSLFKIDFYTPPEKSLIRAPGKLQVLIFALLVCVGVVVWRRVRAQS